MVLPRRLPGRLLALMFVAALLSWLPGVDELGLVPATSGEAEFVYSGVAEDWTVPAGVTEVRVAAWGAQGDAADAGLSDRGGRGGFAEATLAVTPGEVLRVFVGGAGVDRSGGFNGGGTGGSTGGGGGGGASDVRQGGVALADRVVVAGGGGGAGGGATTSANPRRVGTGTTADALRYELRTGNTVFGKSHLQKGEDSLRGLENWLKANPNAPYHDRLVARSLANDLLDALGRSR